MLSFIRKLLVAVMLGAVVLFGFQNAPELGKNIQFTFDLYMEGLQYDAPAFPVFFLIIVSFLLGVLFTGFFGIYEKIARKAESRALGRRIKALEKEVAGYQKQVAELREANFAANQPESDEEEKEVPLAIADDSLDRPKLFGEKKKEEETTVVLPPQEPEKTPEKSSEEVPEEAPLSSDIEEHKPKRSLRDRFRSRSREKKKEDENSPVVERSEEEPTL